MTRLRFRTMLLGMVALAMGLRAGSVAAEDPGLARRVRPILERCAACHSGDEPAGELDLTTREAALRGGESGASLRPGDASASLLVRKVAARKMPPKGPLKDDEIRLLREWIDAGAGWGGTIKVLGPRWALRPVRRPDVPETEPGRLASSPIDAFVDARLRAAGLTPAPPADRLTLIRRASFDLLGLPPTPEEVDSFVHDPAPDAYERLVDRLLASPHYGERWGRHWLDLARFAESDGFEQDHLRPHAWRYRDYVVDSLNADTPYDRFVLEQIAGDVIEPVTPQGIIATGFLVAGPWDEVGHNVGKSELVKKRVREEELEDIVSAVAQTFLGLTVNCARCHDHKFDPIPQRDYYRMKAALTGVWHGDRPAEPESRRAARIGQRDALDRRIGELDDAIERSERSALRWPDEAPLPPGLPAPVARWTFEKDARDLVGSSHGTLSGGARVREGRLRLDGVSGYFRAGPLPVGLKAKTLEAWVALSNLSQRGGGVLSVESPGGPEFDAIVYAERESGKWVAGSEFFRRTRNLSGRAEAATPATLVHLAIVYEEDGRIAVYREGVPYAPAYLPEDQSARGRGFEAGESDILIGLRHSGAGNGFLAGEVEEARLFGAALTPAQVAGSFRAGVSRIDRSSLAFECEDERDILASFRAERDEIRAQRRTIADPPLCYAASPRVPATTHLLARGDVEKPEEPVTPGGLSAVAGPSPEFGIDPDAPEGLRRRKLAEWIIHPDNPLTGRVLVNRVWQHHFGTGIVASPSDFGANGEPPSHPELLDWLASELAANGWRLKPLHRLIVKSDAYRRSGRFDPAAAAVDAESRLLWRFSPRRLEAEAVRDAMLRASGEWNPTAGGPGFRAFDLTVFNSNLYSPTDPIGAEFNRRTLYRMAVNSARSPLLEALDCPDPSVKTPRRAVTITPIQALAMMNDSFTSRQARALAARVEAEADDLAERVVRGYRLALGRPPRADELTRSLEVASRHGLVPVSWALFNTSEFVTLP